MKMRVPATWLHRRATQQPAEHLDRALAHCPETRHKPVGDTTNVL